MKQARVLCRIILGVLFGIGFFLAGALLIGLFPAEMKGALGAEDLTSKIFEWAGGIIVLLPGFELLRVALEDFRSEFYSKLK